MSPEAPAMLRPDTAAVYYCRYFAFDGERCSANLLRCCVAEGGNGEERAVVVARCLRRLEWEPAVVVVLRCCRRGVLLSLPSTTIATHHASPRRIARGGEELDATLLALLCLTAIDEGEGRRVEIVEADRTSMPPPIIRRDERYREGNGERERKATCALLYFVHNVVPSWRKSIRALKTTENVLQQAIEIVLVDACAESLVAQALDGPCLLAELVKIDGYGGEENGLRPSASRKLFDNEWKSEDLTLLDSYLAF
nr:BTB/POZ domain-containing protein At5g17580-like [Ipomoea batatas]